MSDFISKSLSNGGYYIARYEASDANKGNSKSGVTPTRNILQVNASNAARLMYSGNAYVVSDLVNSYMWDTAIVFIQKCSSETTYSQKDGSRKGTLYNTGASSDLACNIYDLCSNVSEWSTEYCNQSDFPVVLRGGAYTADSEGMVYCTSDRVSTFASWTEGMYGYRVGLYVL